MPEWIEPVEQHIFIVIDYKLRHLKDIVIYDSTKVNLQQKDLFSWTKIYFWTLQKGSKHKKQFIATL